MTNSEYKKSLIKRAYKYSLDIINFVDLLSKNDFTIQVLLKQLIRSATSVTANIIEAQASSSGKDFTNFLNHALKSANETKFWLELIRDSRPTPANNIDILIKETEELANILGSSISTLRKKSSSNQI